MQTYPKQPGPVHWRDLCRQGRRALVLLMLGASVAHGGNGNPDAKLDEADDWAPVRTVRGVALQARPWTDGYDAYRGRITVCTTLGGLQRFVADPQRFDEWIPFTEEAAALPPADGAERYYLRTSTPWPLASRDMIYALRRSPADSAGSLRIELEGVPDALPPRDGVVRMRAARGLWTLRPRADRIEVELRLAVEPGNAPALFANRRLGTTVGRMLANLRERFSCPS